MSGLKEAEKLENQLKQLIESMPNDAPERAQQLSELAHLFGARFQDTGNPDDAESAVAHFQEAVNLTPKGHPKLADRLFWLAVALTDRYQIKGKLDDIDAAIQAHQAAVDITPADSPNFPMHVQGLGISMGNKYQTSGDPKDIKSAMQHFKQAVELTPEGHPDLAERLEGLAVVYSTLYKIRGDIGDLEAALFNHQQAVVQTPAGHPNLARCLQSLSMTLCHRYNRFGNLVDIESAIQNTRKALELIPEGNPEHPRLLWSLAMALTSRYQRLGEVGDLQSSLKHNQRAVDLTPEEHPELRIRLKALAFAYAMEFERSDDFEAFNAALRCYKTTLDLLHEDHPDLPECLQNLAVHHTLRYQRLHDQDNLEAALMYDKAAVARASDNTPEMARFLHSLAASYANRFKAFHDLHDLTAALQSYESAVEKTPKGHPELPRRLQSLALILSERFSIFLDPADLNSAFTHYRHSFAMTTSQPILSWNAALVWASLGKRYRPYECLLAYGSAFNILPDILWTGISHTGRQDASQKIDLAGVTSAAASACIELSDFRLAIEILEQGMATTFQQMLQLKTNINELPEADAAKLRQLSLVLYSGASENPQGIAIERNSLLEEIRSRSGFKYFLRPKPYTEICKAAQNGPVIVLNSNYDHCDAIVLLSPESNPHHVALSQVKVTQLEHQKLLLKDLLERCNVRSRESNSSRLFGSRETFTSKPSQQAFEDMLAWLWVNIVGPIFKTLESHNIVEGRIWWCPTGAFTGLPMHAAAASDQFIHSYTTSLGALIDGNSKLICSKSSVPTVCIVGVTHRSAGGQLDLPGVEQEIIGVSSIVGKPNVRVLSRKKATVEAVTKQIENCSWVHLACHGKQDLYDPPKSCLKLYNGTLELETILRLSLSNAEFVFLAACQTAMGDTGMVNESFHLGGGLVAAGFRGAVGTLWSILDADGPVVAEAFYTQLFGGGQKPQARHAAKALQVAVRKMRDGGVPYQRWVPFIHIGVALYQLLLSGWLEEEPDDWDPCDE
ncbi:CHAT domain-containing protein [Mycena latifolia]|nr:CHAT domain-containing protein [Mycena latifolia]